MDTRDKRYYHAISSLTLRGTWHYWDAVWWVRAPSQKESQGESEESASSEQDSTLEAEGENASPRAKIKTSLKEAKTTSPEGNKKTTSPTGATPASPKGAKNLATHRPLLKNEKGKNAKKTDGTSAQSSRITRIKPWLDYGNIHKGRSETPNTARPKPNREQLATPDQQQTQTNETRQFKAKLKTTKTNYKKLKRKTKINNPK